MANLEKNEKFGENSPKERRKSKGDVQRDPLKSDVFDENGKFSENDEFAIFVASPCLPFS